MPLRRLEFQLTSVVGFRGPGRGGLVPGGDRTAPVVTSATVAANGTTVTIVLSKVVVGSLVQPFQVFHPAKDVLVSGSGAGTNTLVFSTQSTVHTTDTPTLTYLPGNLQDVLGNALVAFSGMAMTNNSAQP